MDRTVAVYRRLLEAYGPQHWWPADTGFEVIVGALLMQQTSWANVERAIANLKRSGQLSPEALATARVEAIRRDVKVAGLYRTKPARLKAFCRHLIERGGGDLARYFRRPTDVVRMDLLAQPGVGPETADSILLFAGGHPTFVVDAYTIRIARRVGFLSTDDYAEVQRHFEDHVPRDVQAYREYHALLVQHAKTVCRPKPRCGACAIRSICHFGRARKAEGRGAPSGEGCSARSPSTPSAQSSTRDARCSSRSRVRPARRTARA